MLKVRGHQRIALNRLNGKCIQSFRAALQSHSIFISSSSLVVSASITRGLTYFRIALPNGTRLTEVLGVGFDDAAMRTRRLILERAGHVVTQARDLRQVQAACENTSFAVAVLGQSLNANEKKRSPILSEDTANVRKSSNSTWGSRPNFRMLMNICKSMAVNLKVWSRL